MLAAGACTRCGKPRTSQPGHTSEACAECAERIRAQQRKRSREKRGIPLDAPVRLRVGGRKPDPNIPRSDEYKPGLYTPGTRRHASEIMYGSLSLEDVRKATSTLHLKPPGK